MVCLNIAVLKIIFNLGVTASPVVFCLCVSFCGDCNQDKEVEPLNRQFPLFVNMHPVPPLVVGTAPVLLAKIRLLGRFAESIDLVADGPNLPAEFRVPGVRLLADVPVCEAHRQFRGRPLIVIDCGDDNVNACLADAARALGVPVNVPDKPALCSFYFSSIVDRAPITIAISTAGFAPVLGQHLRSWIEDRLPAKYGRLALYLNRLRDRIHHLPPARRRAMLKHAASGASAARAISGDDPGVDLHLSGIVATGATVPSRGRFSIIDVGSGDPDLLSRRAAAVIRNADLIVQTCFVADEIVDLARREVRLVVLKPDVVLKLDTVGGQPLQNRPLQNMAHKIMSSLIAAQGDGEEVVLLVDNGAERLAADMRRGAGHLLDIDILFSATAYRPDAGQTDAGQTDAGQTDAGQTDAGQTDAERSTQTHAAGAGR